MALALARPMGLAFAALCNCGSDELSSCCTRSRLFRLDMELVCVRAELAFALLLELELAEGTATPLALLGRLVPMLPSPIELAWLSK